MEARMPAAHIIQVCDPKPYHISCNISKSNPTMMVCLLPKVFMRQVSKPVCAMTERMPMAAMNMATASLLKFITSLKYTKKHEYCPASGKYDRNTVRQIMRMVLSFQIFLRAEKGSTCSRVRLLEGLHLSGSDSGTAIMMNSTSRMATMVATTTTTFSLYICSK